MRQKLLSRLLFGSIIASIAITELIVMFMSMVFHGRITPDYLITGAIAALLVSVIVVLVLLHLTKRLIKAEEDRSSIEAKLNEAQRIAHIGSWELGLVENKLWWSNEVYRIFEIDPREFGASYEIFLDTIHPDDRDFVNKTYTDSVANRTRYDIVHRLRFSDGRIKYINERCETFYDETGTAQRSIGTVQDVTKQYQAERALREREQELDAIIENLPSMIFVKDAEQLRFVRINQAGEELLGKSREELIGLNDYDFFPQEQADFFTAKDRQVLESGELEDIEQEPIETPQGSRFLHTRKVCIPDEEGQSKYLLGISNDITERKQIEDALRASEEKYRGIFDESVAAIYVFDKEKRFIDANLAGLDLLGYSREELLGMSLPNVDENPNAVLDANRQPLIGGRLVNYEHGLATKDGRHITVLNNSRPLTEADGTIVGMQSTLIDITKRKQVERALRERDEQVRLLLDSTAEAIYGLDLEGYCTFVNSSCVHILGYDNAEQLLGKEIHSLIHHSRIDGHHQPEEECFIYQAFRTGQQIHRDDEVFWRRDGSSFPVEYWSYPIRRENKVVGAVATFNDITKRKGAEIRIKESLEEKELLLKEIHHRVKNNLQVVSSLIGIQSSKIKGTSDPSSLAAFRETQTRINSMALVHEQLYRSEDFAHIDFQAYVQQLAAKLFNAFDVNPDAVLLDIHIEPIRIDINQAIPCGLIINELLSNALKYAFPKGRKGTITIGMQPYEEQMLKLSVCDDGVGFQEKLDVENAQTLGLVIVNALVKQLRGEIFVDWKGGTCFWISFKRR